MKKNDDFPGTVCDSFRVLKILKIMKLTALFFIFTVLQVFAEDTYSQATKLSMDLGETTVEQVLKKIESESEFYFLFNQKLVDVSREVQGSFRDEKIDKILASVFGGTDVDFIVMDRQIILSPREYLAEARASLQPPTVTGTVTDVDGNPLIGATVQIKGTTSGTVTDMDGSYRITVPEDATLVFSYVGYSIEEVAVAGQTTINVQLEEEVRELEEIVVIGYGTRQKKDVTTSISTIDSREITESIGMSPELAMQGRMTGVHVSSPGGDPTDRPTVRVRGVNTWGIASPLYVIDGVPMTEFGSGAEAQEVTGAGTLRTPINIMTLINPSDIESISVLKDASAAAIYGVRAANGVILITTKKGKAGRPRVNFDARYGISNVTGTYDVLNIDQYVELYQEAFANNPAETANMPAEFDPASPEYMGDMPFVDWVDPALNKNAPTQDYSLQVSGGSEAVTYFLSAGYSRQEGVFINNWLERYSFSTNTDARISERIHAGANYKFAYSINQTRQPGSLGLAFSNPWQPIFDENAPPEHEGFAAVIDTSYDSAGNFYWDWKWGQGTSGNSYALQALNYSQRDIMRHIGNVYVEVELITGLTFKGSLMVDWYQNLNESFEDGDMNMFRAPKQDPLDYAQEGVDDTEGLYSVGHSTRNHNLVKEFTINYNRSFGEHNVDLILNAMDQGYGFNSYNAATEFVPSEDPNFWQVTAPQREWINGESFRFKYALQGYMGRLSYNYGNKYYLDATLRRDGTSRFAPETRWGWFPSFSTAWRVTAEPFMQGLTWLNDLKLRAGWGQLGNQETLNFPYLSTTWARALTSFGYDPNARYVPGMGYSYAPVILPKFPNRDLKWETTTTLNIGFDAFLFNGLEWTFEYYNKLTDGILQQVTLPSSSGWTTQETESPVGNIAEVSNTGIETTLGYRGSLGDLRYYVGGNLTTVHNEVLSMFQDAPIGGGTDRIEVGYPLSYIYGYKWGGIFQTQAEVDEYQSRLTDATVASQSPGDMYFKDIRGGPTEEYMYYNPNPDDSLVNSFDRTFIGSELPGYFYGFNIDLNWKGFDFSMFFQGLGDVDRVHPHKNHMNMSGHIGQQVIDVLDRWTPSNPSTTMPRAVRADPADNNRLSDYWIVSGAYLRLATLRLGYSLPQQFHDWTGVSKNLRIWIGGNNLLLFTDWPGVDPESEDTPRTFLVGLNVEF